MSASAHGGNHDQAFYEAAIEDTFSATATAGSLVNFNSDAEGPLPPGRYLVQVIGLSAGPPAQEVWVHRGKFEAGAVLSPAGSVVGAGPGRFPLTVSIVGLEFHVLSDYSDRVAIQLSAGADRQCYLSRVSTEVRKSNRRA